MDRGNIQLGLSLTDSEKWRVAMLGIACAYLPTGAARDGFGTGPALFVRAAAPEIMR